MSCRQVRILLVAAFAALTSSVSAAEPPAGGEWPQWRGPDRTNVSTETGLLKEWPAGGPTLAWKAEGLGQGDGMAWDRYGRLYISDSRGGQVVIHGWKTVLPITATRIGPPLRSRTAVTACPMPPSL